MKLGDIDWGVLRGSIVLLVIACLISGGVLTGSYYFWGAMQTEFDRQHRQLQSVRRKYHTVDEEEKIIELFLPRFQALAKEGVIGREFRLNWIENLRAVSQDLKLPTLRYTIDTQEVYEAEFPIQEGAFKVFVSHMALDLGLFHEGDLLRFFQELDQRATGLYSVSECAIRRSAQEFQSNPLQANLAANCTLQWFTVKQAES